MANTHVLGISDLRGVKRKNGDVMNFCVFHCVTPLADYSNNHGYTTTQVFINSRLLEGVQLAAPANYDISVDISGKVQSVKFIGTDK